MDIDKPLDAIIAENRKNRTPGIHKRRPSSRRPASRRRPSSAGGTPAQQPKLGAKSASASLDVVSGKILVHHLPTDVSSKEITDFFSQQVGPTRQVILSHNASGGFNGSATIIFRSPEAAKKAYDMFNGIKMDNKSLKIEMVYNPPQPNKLATRLSPNVQNNSSTLSAANNSKSTPQRRRKFSNRKVSRRPKKTAEELDAEMADFFNKGE